eukprot:874158-Lingulodinium_polyedra.AAC.1
MALRPGCGFLVWMLVVIAYLPAVGGAWERQLVPARLCCGAGAATGLGPGRGLAAFDCDAVARA